MKKTILFLLCFVLIISAAACKANSEIEEDDAVVYAGEQVEQEKEDASESKTEQKADDTSKEDIQSDEQPEADAGDSVQSETQQQPIDTDEPDDTASLKIEYSGNKFAEYIDKNGWEIDYSYATKEQKTTYDFSDVFDTKYTLSDDMVNEYEIPNINLGYVAAYVDNTEYSRYFKYANQFPAKSLKYANTDISKLKITDEYVDLWFFLPSETGSVYPHGFVKTQVYELSDDMKNDPYVKMLALKLPDGQSILLYNYDDTVLYKTVGSRLETMHTHFGWDCDSAEDVESIEISGADGTVEITDVNDIAKIYEYLCKSEYDPNLKDGKTLFSNMKVNFKDGHMIYEYLITENGIKLKKMKTPDGFNDYILSLFDK